MSVRIRLICCFAAALAGLLLAPSGAAAQRADDFPYSIMAPEPDTASHHRKRSSARAWHAPLLSGRSTGKRYARRHPLIAAGSPGVVLPTPLPRTQLIPPEGGGAPLVRPARQQHGATVLPGANSPIPNLPHGPETFQDRASRCAFQQQLYNVPGNLGTQYIGACVQ